MKEISQPSAIEETHTSLDYESWYHETRHSNHFNDAYYNARAKIALKKFFFSVDMDSLILDYGCGLGQNIYYLPNAKGYDISTFGIEFCKKKGIDATTNLDEITNEAFDVVFSAHVLEHHPHPMAMLESIRCKLKNDKTFILVIPHEKHGKGKFEYDLNQHLHTWNFQAINNLLITAGFKIIENRYVRGAGYFRLLPIAKISFGLYRLATNLVSRLFGIKEIMVIAKKV